MKFVQLQSHQMRVWDEFVAKHPQGGLYHQSGWQTVLERAFPHMKGHFLALIDPRSEEIIAGLPIYEVRSWILGNRLVSVPYSNWCDPLVSDSEQLHMLLKHAQKLSSARSAKKIEIRCRSVGEIPSIDEWRIKNEWMHHTISLSKTEEQLWSNLSRTAVRQMVQKAPKKEVIVTEENSSTGMREFYDMFVVTRQRLGLPVVPFRFFAAMQNCLPAQATTLLIARRQGRMLGGVMAMKAHGVFHLEFAADADGVRSLGVMQLLYWHALQLAHKEQWTEFSFGRTAIDNAGLIAYKRHWSDVEEKLAVCVWSPKPSPPSGQTNSSAKTLLNRFLKAAPLPVYKMFSGYVYRHWG